MTFDVVILTQEMPDTVALLDGLGAAGDELRVALPDHTGVIQLCDDTGATLLSVEAPILIEVAGEAERLLGDRAAGLAPPLWWVGARAAETEGAEEIARRFAVFLAHRLDGVVWTGEDAA